MKFLSKQNLPYSPVGKIKTFLVAPSWRLKSRREFEQGVANLRKIGFEIINPEYRREEAPVEIKAREIMKAFISYPDTPLILAIRGGYGSMKLLPLINFEKIKKIRRPKILAGFSDISALLNPIYDRTGIVGLHAPMLWNFSNRKLSPITLASFINAISGFKEKELFKYAKGLRVFRRGNPPYRIKGILKGGNMVTLCALTGTRWEIDTRGAILFLEDVDEKTHEIDRMFAHWSLAGKFDRIKGLILGDFKGTEPEEVFEIFEFSYKHLRRLKKNIPVVYCPYLGHTTHKITLPIGLTAILDTSAQKPSLRLTSADKFPGVGGNL